MDSILASASGGCEWDVAKGFSMGVTGVVLQPIEWKFSPNLEADLTMTGVYDKRWVLGTGMGFGGYWSQPNVAGYTDAFAFFTGTMATAPYVETFILFTPRSFGQPNDDGITFRQRLGLKVNVGGPSASIVAGPEAFFRDLSHQPRTAIIGAFVSVNTSI
jgi:hypothetical protein